MDILDLLKGAPGLLDEISAAGLPQDKLPELGKALGSQLGGDDGFDFADLLGGLDLDNFLGQVDVEQLAAQVGISPQIAQNLVGLIGPKVAEFSPSDGIGGALSSIAGKLFD